MLFWVYLFWQQEKNKKNKECFRVGAFRAEEIDKITDAYNEMDKKRTEEESKYRAKQRIFYVALVVLGAVFIVTMFGKKD